MQSTDTDNDDTHAGEDDCCRRASPAHRHSAVHPRETAERRKPHSGLTAAISAWGASCLRRGQRPCTGRRWARDRSAQAQEAAWRHWRSGIAREGGRPKESIVQDVELQHFQQPCTLHIASSAATNNWKSHVCPGEGREHSQHPTARPVEVLLIVHGQLCWWSKTERGGIGNDFGRRT